MTQLSSYIIAILMSAGSIAAVAAEPRVAGPPLPAGDSGLVAGRATIRTLTRSAVAAEGLQKTCEQRQSGDALAPGCATVGIWSQRYIDAIRAEREDDSSYFSALEAHSKFMAKYANLMLQQMNKGKISELEYLDASYGMVEASTALQDALHSK